MFLATSVLTIFLSLIAFIVIVGTIILVHELGHFLVAKKYNVLCDEFSIGFGPCIYKKKFKETTFSLRVIPIGGYVSMANTIFENDDFTLDSECYLSISNNEVTKLSVGKEPLKSDIKGLLKDINLYQTDTKEAYITILNLATNKIETYKLITNLSLTYAGVSITLKPYNRCINSLKVYKRLLIFFAGSFMNLLLGFLVFIIFYFIKGVPNYNSTVISGLQSSYLSSEVLKNGDQILEVNGYPVSTWNDITEYQDKNKDSNTFKIRRDNTDIDVVVPYTYIINNIGISNLSVEKKEVTTGVLVGVVSLPTKELNVKTSLEPGDILLGIKVNTTEYQVSSWQDIINISSQIDVSTISFNFLDASDSNKEITYDKSTTFQSYGVDLLKASNAEKYDQIFGISPVNHFDFTESLKLAYSSFKTNAFLVLNSLKAMIAPSNGIHQIGVSDLTGAVGIFNIISTSISGGILSLLSLAGLLTINIGIMNLLPIPALDGGQILFALYEGLTRKKANKKVEAVITNVCILLLIGLFIFVTFNDILRFF